MEQATYKRFKVLGITDKPECDQCGKTNLKLTVALETEGGEVVHFGSDCASTALKQRYMGKRYSVSRAAVIDIAKRVTREKCVSYLEGAFA